MNLRKNRKGFTLIELLIVVVIVGILALAAVPLITANTEDARSSEARAAMGVIKDRARVVVQRQGLVGGDAAPAVGALGLGTDLNGAYFATGDYSTAGTVAACTLTCAGVYTDAPTDLTFTVNLLNGAVVTDFNR